MTPSDDMWIETELVEPHVADLIRTAQGPATADELVGERAIVARMQAAVHDSHCDGATVRAGAESLVTRRNRRSAVRRLVAAKTAALVALVALGVAAAEAATGVVSAVLPDREPAIERQLTPVATDPPKVPAAVGTTPAGTDTADDARPPVADADGTAGEDPRGTTEDPGGGDPANQPVVPGSHGSSTNHPAAQTETTTTTTTTTPDAPGAAESEQPSPGQLPPGHGGVPPGQQDMPPRGRGRP